MELIILGILFVFTVNSHIISRDHIIQISNPVGTNSISFFGYSTVVIPPLNKHSSARIVIGAPRGTLLDRSDSDKVVEPGVVWQCLLDFESQNDSCEQIPLHTKSGRVLCSNTTCEWNKNGWLGMTMATDGRNRLLICSPLWKRSKRLENSRLNGLCYLVTLEKFTVEKLMPLINQWLQTIQRFPIYSWGQAGFSAHFSENNILIGAPGVNNWNGSVIHYKNILYKDSNIRPTILDIKLLRLFNEIEYLGYSVTSGKYFDSNGSEVLTAVGAPRSASLRGLVFLFRFPVQKVDWWMFERRLTGDFFGSYFGSTLASFDVNGDGLDELFVGAPFRKSEAEDEGCVFVYSAKNLLTSFNNAEIICGVRSGSRFGSSIAFLGDTNFDGFNDVAIGAPYEDENKGAIYIYYGNAEFGIRRNRQPSTKIGERIAPSDLRLQLQGFGHSLYGGVDIDSNGTPDIAVGAYLSQDLVVLRTRPIIQFSAKVDILVNDTFVQTLRDDTNQFVIRVCSRVKRQNIKHIFNRTYELAVKLSVDISGRRFEITEPVIQNTKINTSSKRNSSILFYINVNASETSCKEYKVERILNLPLVPNREDVVINWNISYAENAHLTKGIRKIEIIQNNNQSTKTVGESFDSFCPTCPEAVEIKGSLSLPIVSTHCKPQGSCTLKIKLKLHFHSSRKQEPLTTFLIQDEGVDVILHVENVGEIPSSPTISLNWSPTALSLKNYNPFCISIQNNSSNGLSCSMGLINSNKTERLAIPIDFESFFPMSKSSYIKIYANESTEQTTATLKILSDTQIQMKNDSAEIFIGINNIQAMKTIKLPFDITVNGRIGAGIIRTWFRIPVMYKKMTLLKLDYPIHRDCSVVKEALVRPYFSKLILKPKNVTVLTCDTRDVYCTKIYCAFRQVKAGTNLHPHFFFQYDILKLRALVEKLKTSTLRLQSLAETQLYDIQETTFFSNDLIFQFQIHLYEQQVPGFLPILVGSSCIGILLLFLISAFLSRCGFFNRPGRQALLEGKQELEKWTYSLIYTPRRI